ncbi:MAG: DUF222 domain-containing protein [Actinomycetota bacterium]
MCSILSVRPQGLLPVELADGLRRLGQLAARVEAHRAEFIAEAERQQVARQKGFGSTTTWLMSLSGDPAPVCRSRVAVAAALEGMPETKAAFVSGEVSECRVRLLAQVQALAPEQFAQDEACLVAQAATVSSKRLPQVLAAWRRSTDPDGAVVDAERLHRLRALHLSPAWSGMVHLSGDLDPEGGEVVLAAIRSLAEPAALDPQDTRIPQQRWADALVEICSRHQQGGQAGSGGRPQITVTIPWNTLLTGNGLVDTEAGPISTETVRRPACDATISRIILDGGSIPIEVGRARRVVSPALRRALDLRDGGCTHRGCDIPARWCDAHHLQHWADGGNTDLGKPALRSHTGHSRPRWRFCPWRHPAPSGSVRQKAEGREGGDPSGYAETDR